eukprot:COSAG02_NODE_4721_length_5052_cov_14.669695_2_plen_141_part_00
MVEAEFAASGWLGILTAGLLWTALWNDSTVAQDTDALVRQIVQAADTESEREMVSPNTAGSSDVKDELLRLRDAAGLQPIEQKGTSASETSTKARISMLVPSLPAGVLVTPEMQELSSKLSDPLHTRVGFCGMVSTARTL